MMITIHRMLWIIFLLSATSYGQIQVIFPGLTGQQLVDSLVASYKTTQVLSYSQARDTLFSRIDSQNDSLSCVYTGYRISMPDTVDPTTWAYDRGIDTEHTWPQSKGAVGQARSDMYHLYATRRDVNSARGNDPFFEIPDSETDRWFRLAQVLTSIPAAYIDEYSEKEDQLLRFEPREDHKGNVARSMFYFYTMYRQQADSADPGFFPPQKEVLYSWHHLDPVDSREATRNGLIAQYQGGKSNPFILDSTLVRRAYFSPTLGLADQNKQDEQSFILYQNFPNPFNPSTTIGFYLPVTARVTLKIFNLLGAEVSTITSGQLAPGFHRFEFHGSDLSSGMYLCRLEAGGYFQNRKMLLLR